MKSIESISLRVMVLVSFSIVLWAGGCSSGKKGKFTEEEMEIIPLAQRNNLPAPSGGLVLSVNQETITADEIVTPLEENLRPLARMQPYGQFRVIVRPRIEQQLKEKVTDILLYQRAMETAPENIEEMLEKAVESEVNQFVAQFDGDYGQAQQAIDEMGMSWTTFREYQKRLILTQSYISEQMKDAREAGYAETRDFYEEVKEERYHWDSQLTFRLIDLHVDKIEGGAEAAISQARELVRRARGGEDFALLAKEYSHGHRASQGGQWRPVTVGSLAHPYDAVEQMAVQMAPGQISEPVHKDGRVFIVQLLTFKPEGYNPFEDVQSQLKAELSFRRRRDVFNEMIADLIRQANVGDMQGFVEFCTRHAYTRYGS